MKQRGDVGIFLKEIILPTLADAFFPSLCLFFLDKKLYLLATRNSTGGSKLYH